jgi:beta-glucosidase
MFTMGLFDVPNTGNINNNVTSDSHNANARQIAAAAHVLLKNDGGLLPLSATKPQTLAIIGSQAVNAIVAGHGSGQVTPAYTISAMQGIRAAFGFPPYTPPAYACDTASFKNHTAFNLVFCFLWWLCFVREI